MPPPPVGVLLASVAGPGAVWVLPDSSCTNRNIGKVARYEERLAELCCEDEPEPVVGRVVAVRAGEAMVSRRGGVEGGKALPPGSRADSEQGTERAAASSSRLKGARPSAGPEVGVGGGSRREE